jgi:uncharacterized protein (DUF1684 family)
MDATTLETYRANKDDYLRVNPNSPLPYEYRDLFEGLPYYEWNPNLVFTVEVRPADGAEVTIATSDGTERTYRRAATVTLDIGGQEQTLALYDTGHPGLFLPFRDGTSGRETYGGGRYVDLAPNEDGTVTIDFNLAYSPFCAYNDGYSCALPPAENWMTVPVEAGEKTWRKPS